MADFLIGVASGLIGLAGLLLSNGLLASHRAWTGEFFAIAVAAAMAVLGATARGRGRPSAASGAAALVTGLMGGLMAGPNPSFYWEFGIDRMLLLPIQDQLLAGPPRWQPGPFTLIVALAAALVGGGLATLTWKKRRWLVHAVLAAVVGSFLAAAVNMNPRNYIDTAQPPTPHQYVMDGFLYLRVHDLMQQGQSYYPSFYTAYVERKGEEGIPGNWLNWRPPVLFWLWQPLPGGPQGVLVAFWLCAGLTLVAAYVALQEKLESALALWAPALLGAYYLYGADTMWYTSQEWWGSFFMIMGMCAFTRRHPALGAALWALAVTSREHFGFLLPLMLWMALLQGRKERICAALSSAFILAIYAIHYTHVAPYVTPGNPGIHAWNRGGLEFIQLCLQFGTVYLAGRNFLLLPLVALGIAGALSVRDPYLRVMHSGAVLMPMLTYLVIGQDGRYYWGIVLLPQLLMCVALICNRLEGCARPPDDPPG